MPDADVSALTVTAAVSPAFTSPAPIAMENCDPEKPSEPRDSRSTSPPLATLATEKSSVAVSPT